MFNTPPLVWGCEFGDQTHLFIAQLHLPREIECTDFERCPNSNKPRKDTDEIPSSETARYTGKVGKDPRADPADPIIEAPQT